DTLEYEALLKDAYGEAKTEEYLSRSIHHVLVYPYLSVQSPLQQLRCLRPVAPDKTMSEIWHFRLKGAPEAIYRRSLWYYNLVNSPATMINADDLEHLLAQEVVIEAGDAAPSGAQRIAPDHSPRAKAGTVDSAADALPNVGLTTSGDVQREVEQFLYRQAELLDGKHWQGFIDLFADDGVYWMPVTREQTEWEGSPSIFAEDKLMMEIRKGRVSHPNAWSQAPMWETNHLVGQ